MVEPGPPKPVLGGSGPDAARHRVTRRGQGFEARDRWEVRGGARLARALKSVRHQPALLRSRPGAGQIAASLAAILAAQRAGSAITACSQRRIVLQPRPRSSRFTRTSLAALRASFGPQYSL